MTSHQKCNHLLSCLPALKKWRPSRLIYIKDVNNLVLHLCRDIPEGVKYVTLSHCWGNIPEAQRLTLTKENFDSWTREIPDLKPMRTFHHAVTICQKLGFEYIWIDSLWIIQDSQDDWYKQASLMSEVYKYSQCTISATAANDDTVGCFFDRNPEFCLPIRVEIAQNPTPLPGTTKHSILEPNPEPGGISLEIHDIFMTFIIETIPGI